ncbi:aldo/keto reductase [Alicyclobacillus dauci]|uniref:Aldo/keto reductase n=1 Tax=Alicyclobacillus dauci TaxID=1475485 RepID=A0ABY6Z0V1_9BACL|nr:aldo/keto reductase [Alicyclobacillus dauci]WAH36499.1 aldo/keto reductase [Alicyclobacillus dauci]
MQRKRLGRSELEVGEIGFGCMSLGTNAKTATRLVHHAIHEGVNLFDTADLYDQGRNEEILGKALRGRRNKVVIATKVGNRFDVGKPGWNWDPSPAYILQAVEQSLRRLETDYIDLYQLHGGTMDDPFDSIVETFERLKEKGWIRAYGISSIRPNVIRRFLSGSNVDTIMMQYSLLDRRPEEWFGDIEQRGVSIIARGPLARGLLSGTGKQLPAGETYVDRTAEQVAMAQDAVESLANNVRTASQVSLRYALNPPVVSVAIPGASRFSQLTDNIGAAQVMPLTDAEIAWLNGASEQNRYVEHRP